MSIQERTETPLGTNFAKHQAVIDKHQLGELRGWWAAALECRKKWNGNASDYARRASKDSATYARENGVRAHSEATIRQYIGPMMKAQEAGFTVDQFDDVRTEMRSDKKSNKKPKTRREELRSFLTSLSVAELEFVMSEAKAVAKAKRK